MKRILISITVALLVAAWLLTVFYFGGMDWSKRDLTTGYAFGFATGAATFAGFVAYGLLDGGAE